MTPENQPEKGFTKKAYGIVKGAGHTFKRVTLGDIYSLIETRADEAKGHREENFRYLNTKIDTQIGEVRQEIGSIRQEIGAVNQRVDSLGQKIDTQVGQLRQEMNNRMDSLDRKIDSQIGEVNKRLDTIMQILFDLSKQKV